MAEKPKILIIGGTGYIGKFIVEASIKSGNPTFILVREPTISDPLKGKLIEGFKNSGATVIYGDLYDHESLVKAFKQVDVVISAVGFGQIADQVKVLADTKEASNIKGDLNDLESFVEASKQVDITVPIVLFGQITDQVKIISAIKEAGNIKRFFPSEFGNDMDRCNAVDPIKSVFASKVPVRRAIEVAEIPYTYISANCFAGYFLPNLSQPGATSPPRDKVVILGDGNVKAVFNKEEDIGTYTIKAVNDPRTLNKTLYIRPPGNALSLNELVSLWEKKIGKTLEKEYVPEEQVLKNIQEAPMPLNLLLSNLHALYIKGDQTSFEIEPSSGVEASQLYPEFNYTTVDEYLDQYI